MSRLALSASFGALALTLSFFSVACTSETSNDAPILDYVDSPLVVTAENGSYAIPLTIGFHDNNGEVVTHVRARSIAPSFDEIIEIRNSLPTRETAALTLVLPASVPISEANRQLEITIIDGRGAESLPLPRTITLK